MRLLFACLLLGATAAWAGGGHGHAGGSESAGAAFKEGVGLTLSAETRDAIGLSLADVDEGPLRAETRVTAQVYRSAQEVPGDAAMRRGYAYASAILPSDTVRGLELSTPVRVVGLVETGRVFAVERALEAASGSCEVLVEIPDSDARLGVGAFVEAYALRATASVVRVPRAAVLEAASGTFVYAQNGSALLRTAVTTGAHDASHVAIVDGLYAGDVVAATAVENLYLIELRATKGGGHSH